jgi:hypothetical protein
MAVYPETAAGFVVGAALYDNGLAPNVFFEGGAYTVTAP